MGNKEPHANTGHVTKTAIFENSWWRMAAILKIALSPYFSRELFDYDQIWYTQMQISIPSMEIWQKLQFFKFKMTDGHHIEYRVLGISQSLIGRSTRNSERRWRISCRYWSHDENGNFRKFKMADGRHLENSFISISSRELSNFDQIWFTYANLHSEHGNLTKNRNFSNSRWRTDAILKIGFGRLTRNSEWRWRMTCRYRSRDQNGNFPKFMIADSRHFENSFQCLRHSCNELMLSSVFSIGVLVSMKSRKQQILYRKTAHSLSTFV